MEGIDLSGKTAIVTGGYSGIGIETARALRDAGAKVIVPARDVERAQKALEGIDVEVVYMDLLDPASISTFARDFVASEEPLHLLINSAGVMARPLERDARGYELQFATNHLGHFLLTTELWPALLKANGARVVAVSSWGHHIAPVDFEDPNFEHREYDPWASYGQSKTANILFAVELDRQGVEHGIRAFAVHPGSIVDTNLGKHLPKEMLLDLGVIDDEGNAIIDPSRNLKTVEQGAATSVWCAVSPQLEGLGGVYCENCEVSPLENNSDGDWRAGGSLGRIGVMPYAVDEENAKRLWELSEELVG